MNNTFEYNDALCEFVYTALDVTLKYNGMIVARMMVDGSGDSELLTEDGVLDILNDCESGTRLRYVSERRWVDWLGWIYF